MLTPVNLYLFALILVFAIIPFWFYRKRKRLLSGLTIFSSLCIIEVCIPGLIFLNGPPPMIAFYMKLLLHEDYLKGIITFSFAIIPFFLSYFFCFRALDKREPIRETCSHKLRPGSVYLVLGIFIILYGYHVFLMIKLNGSYLNYVQQNLISRWRPEPIQAAGVISSLYLRLFSGVRFVGLCLLSVVFFYRHELSRTTVLIVFLVVFFTSLDTMSRGTQLGTFLVLAATEELRSWALFQRVKNTRTQADSIFRGLTAWKTSFLFCLIGSLVFFLYGTGRNYLGAKYTHEHQSTQTRELEQKKIKEGLLNYLSLIRNIPPDDLVQKNNDFIEAEVLRLAERNRGVLGAFYFEISRFFRGEALVGLSGIVRYYSDTKAYFHGKTMMDAALLVIPRFFWIGKPEWYGIADITRRMGWAPTTQDAVTMPGELFANFGPLGLLGMVFWGILFAICDQLAHGPISRFIFLTLFIPNIFLVFWMSFTGLMNIVIYLPLLFGTLFYLISPQKVET